MKHTDATAENKAFLSLNVPRSSHGYEEKIEGNMSYQTIRDKQ
jgi:hypothetical protein